MPEKPFRDRILEERVLARGPSYDAVELTIRSSEGREWSKAAIRHRGAVVILPLIEQPGRTPRVVLIRNERLIPGELLLECPAGGIEAGESPAEAAERELREETGYTASSLYPLGRFYTTPGMTDELMHAFVASGLMHVGQDLRDDESLTVHRFAVGEVLDKIGSGEIRDGKTMLAVLLAHRRGLLNG
jgi:ADP-ribose pyrophosphatase